MPILVDIVTRDRRLVSDEVDMVTLPGSAGQMGILRGHAPLLSTLEIGEIILHKGNDVRYIAIGGGVVEVRPDKVIVLAESAEQAEEIDEARAAAALQRARESLAENPPRERKPIIEAALQRSTLRLKVARRRSSRPQRPGPSFEEE
ncbi:MAG: F0F1 ATP synthase subunit epsilon [Caldilineaceae bacterium]|nr:F0F1 ATP synthase subunit epsilon [Caldilineaceae bacterium]